MIDQVFFDPGLPGKQVLGKKFGEYRIFTEKKLQAFFLDPECGNGCNCSRSGAIDGRDCQAFFTQKCPGTENGDDCFFSVGRHKSEFYFALFNVMDGLCVVAWS